LMQIDACSAVGQIGALLRREGLYSSHLTNWRLLRSQGLLDSSATKKRAAKPTNRNARVSQLERENTRLKARLRQAELVLDIQKKVSEMLGIPLKAVGSGGNDS
jgi:transposase